MIRELFIMERIVRRSKNLIWDGYDVIQLFKDDNPVIHKDARFVNGKWYRSRTIPLTRDGWVLNGKA